LLVGAGLVARTRTCYFGLEIFGLAPMFSRAVEAGTVRVIEESEASIALGLRATMARIGFMPGRAWQGTEMFRARPDVKLITDPYSGEFLTAFPAIPVDVAIIHVLRADHSGNCLFGANPTIDRDLVVAAGQVIITAEELVDRLEPPIDLPGLPVTAVVHAPRGAWPTSCYPLYQIDGEEILRYIAACNAGEFEAYVNALSQAPTSNR
jgi:glutaconate CoA-transferase subunit A